MFQRVFVMFNALVLADELTTE